MLDRWRCASLLCAGLLCAADVPWKDKKVPEWTAEDAALVMTASPWAKMVTPELDQSSSSGSPGMGRRGGMGGRGGGMGGGGIGIGMGGIGFPGGMGGRRSGGGYPGGGGGYPGGGGSPGGGRRSGERGTPPELNVRWESALPVREAELKARETDAPTIDEAHFAIAVYGVPRRMAGPDEKKLIADLKKHAVLKREGKKDFKPSSVQVLQREEGPVIVYLFPRSTEITKADRRIEFSAQIGRLKLVEPFFIEDMFFEGKLEL